MSFDVDASPTIVVSVEGGITDTQESGPRDMTEWHQARPAAPADVNAPVPVNDTNGHSMATQSVPETRVKKKPPRRATVDSPNICFECKTTDSKLWRRGPDGQLMCNACGLRWRRSHKPRDPPKSTPRKRKMQSPSSLSPQSPQPMTLPQSSMAAAKRGGLLKHPFQTTAHLYGSMPGAQQNFGQLVYQPQNMYLHQQQQLARQAQSQQQMVLGAPVNSTRPQDSLHAHSSTNHGTPQNSLHSAAPAIVTESRVAEGTSVSNGDKHDSAQEGHKADEAQEMQHLENLTTLHDEDHNLEQTHELTTHDPLSPNGHQGDHSSVSTTKLAMPDISLQALDHAVPHDFLSDGDQQNDDFSGLLSLKAFVDDTGRQF